MLPASELAEIISSLTALNLQPNTTAQVLAAVIPPLLRSSEPEKEKRAAGQPIAIRFVDNRDQP